MAAFDRLIRFQTAVGSVKYGNLEKEVPTREIEGNEVEVLEGDVKSGFKKSGEKTKVSKLLSPINREELNIILCVGLNYRRHAEECNVSSAVFSSDTEGCKC
jgi:transcription initiation factor TFIIH subunit 2